MKRPVWLAAGVAIGVGGTLWAEQRVRRQIRRVADKLTPEGLVSEMQSRARGAGERVRNAVDAGRLEHERTQHELWRDLGGAHPGTSDRDLTPSGRGNGARGLPETRTTRR